jgi:hypothetical protein
MFLFMLPLLSYSHIIYWYTRLICTDHFVPLSVVLNYTVFSTQTAVPLEYYISAAHVQYYLFIESGYNEN